MSAIERAGRVGLRGGAIGAIVLAILLAPFDAEAVPAFARRYETSCATCHQAFPRLNAVGESFRLNGFVFVDEERYRKVHPVELGDEAYKRLWPNAMWPTDVPRHSPLSFVMRNMAELDMDGTRPTTTTFLLPEEVELVWAGNLGEDIAFYGDVIYLQKDFGGAQPDSWATVKGWAQFQDLFVENAFNVRLGTVGTQSIGLFTARDANFYGTHFYLYTSWLVPVIDAAAAGLAAFEGNNFTIGPQAGIEVNGFGQRWYYAVGLANGGLNDPAGGPPESDVVFFGMGNGGGSDTYAQLAYKIGGIPFDRSFEETAEALTTASEFWRDDSLTMSLFAYSGCAEVSATGLDGVTVKTDDEFWRLGIGLQQQYGDLSLSAAWVEGSDDRPYGILSPDAVDTTAYHVEAIWFAFPWLLPYARYEVVNVDMPAGVPGVDPEQDISRFMIGAKAMIRPNVGFIAETAFYSEGEHLEPGFDGTLFMLLSLSF